MSNLVQAHKVSVLKHISRLIKNKENKNMHLYQSLNINGNNKERYVHTHIIYIRNILY